ncbi:MAG: DUF3386 family protein [Acidobacteriota bacterium]
MLIKFSIATKIAAVVITIALSLICVLAQQPKSASVAAVTTKADPEAYALLKTAHDARETWPSDFAGFTAELVFNDNGATTTGTFSYVPQTGVAARIEGLSDEAQKWLNNQLNSVLSHRRGGDFAKRDGAHPITFAEDDKSPLGRLVQLNDALKSSYRVRDGKVVEVTRTMGDERFTITVLETTPLPNGRYLPRHFTVTYFDAKTGTLKRTETFTDSYTKISEVWYPISRRVVRAENGRLIARVIEIKNPQLKSENKH